MAKRRRPEHNQAMVGIGHPNVINPPALNRYMAHPQTAQIASGIAISSGHPSMIAPSSSGATPGEAGADGGGAAGGGK